MPAPHDRRTDRADTLDDWIAQRLAALPLVGRSEELSALRAALEEARAGRDGTVILVGEAGVGKTRLVTATADEAERHGWRAALGRAYPVETGIPYALFADALLPLLRQLDAPALATLTRGSTDEVAYLFPALAAPDKRPILPATDDPAALKSRLFWNFSQLLSRLAAKQPLLVVLEDLQFADASSLELLHFVARQLGGGGARVMLLCTYSETERERNAALGVTEQSLISLGVARRYRVRPLAPMDVEEVIRHVFDVDPVVIGKFARLLHDWTRGNPTFISETLRAVLSSGTLYRAGNTWLGWDAERLDVPGTIRDALMARVARLSAPARMVMELAATIGTRSSYEVLRSATALAEPELLGALDELRRAQILTESDDGGNVTYGFREPMLRDAVYAEQGLARRRVLHTVVAETLERVYGDAALEHADELAFHFTRGEKRDLAPAAVKYLSAAGRQALAKSADREAERYLAAALEQVDRGAAVASPDFVLGLVEDLARARERLGEYDAAFTLWTRAREAAMGDQRRLAAVERHMGLACHRRGRHEEALQHFEKGLEAAQQVEHHTLAARLQVARALVLQELGQPEEARRALGSALEIAERSGDSALLAHVYHALLQLHLWSGSPDLAREHAARAIRLARSGPQQTAEWTVRWTLPGDQRFVTWSAHWALAMLGVLTGATEDASREIAESEHAADELRSQMLRVWTAEASILYATAVGTWDTGIALAERTIALARALNQYTLLPRLLVWSGFLHLGRNEVEIGKQYVHEAWELSGAGGSGSRAPDVHAVVPAHTGLATYYATIGDHARAIRIAETGLTIADRTGYVLWGIYRLLPLLAELYLRVGDGERAASTSARLRRDAERLGHTLGLAWADACDALIVADDRDCSRAIPLLSMAADRLEAVPFLFDAARLRRELARCRLDVGDREEALRDMRRAHDLFARLGAERELRQTRDELRELGARTPARAASNVAARLTPREMEIVRLAAERKSNKEIGRALGLSPRTVSTHLSNIFAKLSIDSREALTEYLRKIGVSIR